MVKEEDNTLYFANLVINITTLIITILFQAAFFIRFKFKADKAAAAILLIYLVVNFLRIALSEKLFGLMDILVHPATTTLIYSLLYFFVFELSYSKALLQAQSPQEYEREKKRIKILKFVSIGSMVFVYLPTTLYIIIVKNMQIIPRIMLYIRAVSMLVPTFICFPIFLKNLKFFSMILMQRT